MRTHRLLSAPVAFLALVLTACGDQPVAPPEHLGPAPLQAVVENEWWDFTEHRFMCFEPVLIEGRVHTVVTSQETENHVSFTWQTRLIGTGTGEFTGGTYKLNEVFAGSTTSDPGQGYPFIITIKDRIKLLLDKPVWVDDANAKRHEFSRLVRETYDSHLIIDIAEAESTRPDGTRQQYTKGGQTYYTLVPGYTTDGGHLNDIGKKWVAEEMVRVIARNIDAGP